ncbi:neurofilament medium polypeptide-like [Phymastichus coffea]|uniref:neurofilament medium polypeptide-like n=1 Tax=Phymastichus coffea TaxID=108790 RepID=UPI00273BBD10|nr:neurofilament medium polypeptide-like [Phymastichus coffea]
MVEEIEQEKTRLEAMEVAEPEEPPQPLPEGQERERLLRWALTFQARIPESDWRREERRRMEVVRAIREEMETDQTDGRTAETLSEHGTLKSHCSDTSKGSQLSLDGQAEKELEDYLGRGTESVPARKGETINPQPTGPPTPPPSLRRPGTVKPSTSTISATTAQPSVSTSHRPSTTAADRPSTSTTDQPSTPAADQPSTSRTTDRPPIATDQPSTPAATNRPSTSIATDRPHTSHRPSTTAATDRPSTSTTIQPSASRSRGHPGWLPVTSTPIGRTTTTRPIATTRMDHVDRPEVQGLHYRTASGKRRKYNPRLHLQLDDLTAQRATESRQHAKGYNLIVTAVLPMDI